MMLSRSGWRSGASRRIWLTSACACSDKAAQQAKAPIKIRIGWGSDFDIDEPDLEDIVEYGFATRAEADAFLLGVHESNGWHNYAIIEDGEVVRTSNTCWDDDNDDPIHRMRSKAMAAAGYVVPGVK
jgi:hypothetical protein